MGHGQIKILHTRDSLLAQQAKAHAMYSWHWEFKSGAWPLPQTIPSAILLVTYIHNLVWMAQLYPFTTLLSQSWRNHSQVMDHYTHQIFVAHAKHWTPLQLPETVSECAPGIAAKASVTLVHPAQAYTELCGNPYAYPSKILCCFPSDQAIFKQNKHQFDVQFEFWALLFVT